MRQLNDWACRSDIHQLVPKTIRALRPNHPSPGHPTATGYHVVYPGMLRCRPVGAMLIYVLHDAICRSEVTDGSVRPGGSPALD